MGWGYNSVRVVVCAKYTLKEDGDKEQEGSGVMEATGGWELISSIKLESRICFVWWKESAFLYRVE